MDTEKTDEQVRRERLAEVWAARRPAVADPEGSAAADVIASVLLRG